MLLSFLLSTHPLPNMALPNKLLITDDFGNPERFNRNTMSRGASQHSLEIRAFIEQHINHQSYGAPEWNDLMDSNILPRDTQALRWYRYDTLTEQALLLEKWANLQFIPTYTYEQYSKDPFFPAILKTDVGASSKWEWVYVIEEQAQLDKLHSLSSNVTKQFDPYLIFQPLIETPSDYFTSIRVLLWADWNIYGAGLLYNAPAHSTTQLRVTDEEIPPIWVKLDSLLQSTHNPYALHSRRVQSNHSQGGGIIPLTHTPYPHTGQESSILQHHTMRTPALNHSTNTRNTQNTLTTLWSAAWYRFYTR